MFKKPTARRGNIRKRDDSADGGETGAVDDLSTATPIVIRASDAASSSTASKRVTSTPSSTMQMEDAIQARHDPGILVRDTAFQSKRTAHSLMEKDTGVTADTHVDTEYEERIKRQLELEAELDGKADDEIYRGKDAYTKYFKKKDTAMGNVTSSKIRVGPQRASGNIRVTSRFDYQPDVCKDYKETGYCGFGDSCKFMHDRSDYKHGWQIEREWEAEQRKKHAAEAKRKTSSDDEANDDDDEEDEEQEEVATSKSLSMGTGDGSQPVKKKKKEELPFACLICRKDFMQPVVTKCQHYFCETCAIKQFKKSPKCFACGLATNGFFQPARELMKKIKEKRELEATRLNEGTE